MKLFACACLVLVFLWLALVASIDTPQPPTFLRAPHLLTETEEIWVEVQITPRDDIRAVILEAWEASERHSGDDLEFPAIVTPHTLIRSSVEPVNDGNRSQRFFRFRWRHSLRPGLYVLVARITVSRGLTYASKLHRLQVV